jgi:flagellar biosynthesis/type III secretory pathway protein FliH
MPDEFVPFEVFLSAPVPDGPDESDDNVLVDDIEAVTAEKAVGDCVEEQAGEMHEVISEIRRFRAALADALDFALEQLLHDIAASVLARELQLAPADIACIAEQARRRYADEEPITLRVHPAEVECAALAGFPTQGDERLRRGDATLVLRTGTIDLSLGARLAALFET